jgi:glycosyltransferase involved in cell wall biosynthesis
MSKVKKTRFSLVLATLARTWELERFLSHLREQRFHDFELIVVDQNLDQRLEPVLDAFKGDFRIVRVNSKSGLSRARNVGLEHATGNVVGFPDDDCWYPPGTLDKVARLLSEHPEWDGVTGKSATNVSGDGYKWFDSHNGMLTKFNVWRRSTSYTIFLRRPVITAVGGFDEYLGVGAESGRISAEEVDYLIRCLSHGFKLFYNPELLVCHTEGSRIFNRSLVDRGYGYSLGVGHVLRKHKYPVWFFLQLCFRALAGAIVAVFSLNRHKAHYHCAVLKGRLLGWLG